MANDDFEWDEAKAAENYARHGITFETAVRVFDDAFAVERFDAREDYGEDRYSIQCVIPKSGYRFSDEITHPPKTRI